MKTTVLSLAIILTLSSACSRNEHAEDEHAGHDESGAAGSHGDEADNLLRIQPTMMRDLRITTTKVESRPDSEAVSLLGELGVNEDAFAEAGPPVPARALKLHVKNGDVVRKGQPLAELQSAQLGEARAAHLQAESRVSVARQALERKELLAAERIVPQREVQEAEAEANTAEAELAGTRATLESLGISGDGSVGSRFVLRAPISGTVVDRLVVQGQVTDPAQPLFRIADLSRLWLIVHAFERDAVRIQVGAPASVTLPAFPGRDFTGAVSYLGRQVEASSRTVPIRIELPNRDGSLRPGMSATAQVRIRGQSGTVLALPATALQRMAAGWSVFLPRGEGRFEVRSVGRGRDLGGEVEILSGLRAGETVVVDGAFLLKAEAEKASGAGEKHEH